MPGQYSTDLVNQELVPFHNEFHVPFSLQISVVPASSLGRRSVARRDLEKIARFIQEDLEDNGVNVATPIAMVPQFGNFSAKVNVTGFVSDLVGSQFRTQNGQTTSNVDRIHSGNVLGEKTSLRTGNIGGGNLSLEAAGQSINTDVNAEAEAFAAMIDAMLALPNTFTGKIDKLFYNGVQYGRNGRSI